MNNSEMMRTLDCAESLLLRLLSVLIKTQCFLQKPDEKPQFILTAFMSATQTEPDFAFIIKGSLAAQKSAAWFLNLGSNFGLINS